VTKLDPKAQLFQRDLSEVGTSRPNLLTMHHYKSDHDVERKRTSIR
jgi:hypothetical protein